MQEIRLQEWFTLLIRAARAARPPTYIVVLLHRDWHLNLKVASQAASPAVTGHGRSTGGTEAAWGIQFQRSLTFKFRLVLSSSMQFEMRLQSARTRTPPCHRRWESFISIVT